MQSERVAHVLTKAGIYRALDNAVRRAGSDCIALADGATVKIDAHTAFVPDCTVQCGPIDFEGVFATNPVVVAEVISPSSQAVDIIRKFPQYFRVPSIQHYLIVDTDKRTVVHHQRDGEKIASRIFSRYGIAEGVLTIDPPGIIIQIADFFADLPPPPEDA